MNYTVVMYASYDRLTSSCREVHKETLELPEEQAHEEEVDIMGQVDGGYYGMKHYSVPAENITKLINLVAEFNVREDREYIMNLEIYNPAKDKNRRGILPQPPL